MVISPLIAKKMSLIVLAVVLAGCASISPMKPEEAVSIRSQLYWSAIIAGKWDEAYSYTSPAYRLAVDAFHYRKKHDGFVKYQQAEVITSTCEEADVCKVAVRLNVIIMDAKMVTVKTIEERWLKDSGQWYRYIDR